jgi:hypothetical protein
VTEVDAEVSEVRDAIPEIEAAETPPNDEGGAPTDDPTDPNDAFTDHEANRHDHHDEDHRKKPHRLRP